MNTTVILCVLVIILIILLGYYLMSRKRSGMNPQNDVHSEETEKEMMEIQIPEGKSLVYFDGSWRISYSSLSLPKGSNYVLTDLSPLNYVFVANIQCNDAIVFKSKISYTVGFNTNSLNINTLSIQDRNILLSMINNIIESSINSYSYDGKDLYDKTGDYVATLNETIDAELNSMGLYLISFSINLNEYNQSLIKSLYEEKGDVYTPSETELAEKNASKEIKLSEIENKKLSELNKLKLIEIKENNEFELAKKELDDEKISKLRQSDLLREMKLRKSKEEAENEANLKAEKERLNLEKMTHENNIKIAEMESEEVIKLSSLNKQSKSAEIESEEFIELKKIESANTLSEKNHESEIKKLNENRDKEIAKMEAESEIKKKEYSLESSLQYEKRASKERELELSVKLPAEAEAEKNKILANSKAEVKKIDTESAIEASKAKLLFKKEESETLAEIKKTQDLNDMEIYEKMMNISEKNVDLAIQWKLIDKIERIAQIQGESLTKMNLGQITINGPEGGKGLADYINSLAPIFNQIKLPELGRKLDNELSSSSKD